MVMCLVNMKRFNEECNYLLRRNISTLSEFENYILSLNDQIGSSVSSMNEKKEKIKELQQLIEQAKVYKELKPIAEELKKEQYRFKKAKVKYQEEHETELRRYYMVKRKLKEAGFEKEPFPLKAWEKELQQLEAQYSEEYEAYKPMNQDLKMLYQIKGDVDKVMRELHPELLQTQKNNTEKRKVQEER